MAEHELNKIVDKDGEVFNLRDSSKLGKTGDASNTTTTFTKASGDTSSITSGSKLSAIFTAISSFFASLKSLAFKDKVSTGDINDDAITAAKVKDNENLPVNISGNAATANKAMQDANGRNIAQNYALKSELPSPGSDVFYLDYGTTSFEDALSAFDNGEGKKLILRVGKAGSGAFSTTYYLPLYRLQFKGNTITQFVWMLDSDAYGDAAGSNTYGSIQLYKLSESGWSSSSDTVDYAKAAGTAYGGVADYLKYSDNNEINFKNVPTSGNKGQHWFNYRNGDNGGSDASNPLTDYYFGDRKKGTDTTLHAKRLAGSADKWNGWNIVVGSTGTDANTIYFV